MIRTILVAAILAASLSVNMARAGGVPQGSFERPPVVGTKAYSNGQRFKGWRVVGDPGDIFQVGPNFSIGGVPFPAQHKKQWVCLTGSTRTFTGVERSVDTVPGTYELSFYVGNINDPSHGLGSTSTVRIFVDGTEITPATNSGGTATSFVWKKFKRTINATSAKTKLRFMNGDPSNDGINGLDHISLISVP
jgi:hypothetical protein